MKTTPTRKPYQRKKTACICSRPGVKPISGGWICAFCINADEANARNITRTRKRSGRPEGWKYVEIFTCHSGGGQ